MILPFGRFRDKSWVFPMFSLIFQSNKHFEVFSVILRNIVLQQEMETNVLCSISTKFLIKNKVDLLASILYGPNNYIHLMLHDHP